MFDVNFQMYQHYVVHIFLLIFFSVLSLICLTRNLLIALILKKNSDIYFLSLEIVQACIMMAPRIILKEISEVGMPVMSILKWMHYTLLKTYEMIMLQGKAWWSLHLLNDEECISEWDRYQHVGSSLVAVPKEMKKRLYQ